MSAKVGRQGLESHKVLYDFNDMKFKAIRAPY